MATALFLGSQTLYAYFFESSHNRLASIDTLLQRPGAILTRHPELSVVRPARISSSVRRCSRPRVEIAAVQVTVWPSPDAVFEKVSN